MLTCILKPLRSCSNSTIFNIAKSNFSIMSMLVVAVSLTYLNFGASVITSWKIFGIIMIEWVIPTDYTNLNFQLLFLVCRSITLTSEVSCNNLECINIQIDILIVVRASTGFILSNKHPSSGCSLLAQNYYCHIAYFLGLARVIRPLLLSMNRQEYFNSLTASVTEIIIFNIIKQLSYAVKQLSLVISTIKGDPDLSLILIRKHNLQPIFMTQKAFETLNPENEDPNETLRQLLKIANEYKSADKTLKQVLVKERLTIENLPTVFSNVLEDSSKVILHSLGKTFIIKFQTMSAKLLLKEYSKVKTKILLTISHELKNSINCLTYLTGLASSSVKLTKEAAGKIQHYTNLIELHSSNFCTYFKYTLDEKVYLNNIEVNLLAVAEASLFKLLGRASPITVFNNTTTIFELFLKTDIQYLEQLLCNCIYLASKLVIVQEKEKGEQIELEFLYSNTDIKKRFPDNDFSLLLCIKASNSCSINLEEFESSSQHTSNDFSIKNSLVYIKIKNELIKFLAKLLDITVFFFNDKEVSSLVSKIFSDKSCKYLIVLELKSVLIKQRLKLDKMYKMSTDSNTNYSSISFKRRYSYMPKETSTLDSSGSITGAYNFPKMISQFNLPTVKISSNILDINSNQFKFSETIDSSVKPKAKERCTFCYHSIPKENENEANAKKANTDLLIKSYNYEKVEEEDMDYASDQSSISNNCKQEDSHVNLKAHKARRESEHVDENHRQGKFSILDNLSNCFRDSIPNKFTQALDLDSFGLKKLKRFAYTSDKKIRCTKLNNHSTDSAKFILRDLKEEMMPVKSKFIKRGSDIVKKSRDLGLYSKCNSNPISSNCSSESEYSIENVGSSANESRRLSHIYFNNPDFNKEEQVVSGEGHPRFEILNNNHVENEGLSIEKNRSVRKSFFKMNLNFKRSSTENMSSYNYNLYLDEPVIEPKCLSSRKMDTQANRILVKRIKKNCISNIGIQPLYTPESAAVQLEKPTISSDPKSGQLEKNYPTISNSTDRIKGNLPFSILKSDRINQIYSNNIVGVPSRRISSTDNMKRVRFDLTDYLGIHPKKQKSSIVLNKLSSQYQLITQSITTKSKNDKKGLLSMLCAKKVDYFETTTLSKKIVHVQSIPKKREKCYCNDVLVVDDEEINVKAMKLLLKKAKLNCDSCNDGVEAVRKVKYNLTKTCCAVKYKLIFMDLMMPNMQGDEASRCIEQIYFQNNEIDILNIIVVSAHEGEYVSNILKGIKSIKYFIPKPINKKVLEEVLFKFYFQSNINYDK